MADRSICPDCLHPRANEADFETPGDGEAGLCWGGAEWGCGDVQPPFPLLLACQSLWRRTVALRVQAGLREEALRRDRGELRDLIRESAPLAWVATQNMDAAAAWEKRAHATLPRGAKTREPTCDDCGHSKAFHNRYEDHDECVAVNPNGDYCQCCEFKAEAVAPKPRAMCNCASPAPFVSLHLALVAPAGARWPATWGAVDLARAFPCAAVINRGTICSECGLGVAP